MTPSRARSALICSAVFITIGSTEDRYWLELRPPNVRAQMWWGWYRHLGKPCVDARLLPILAALP